MKLIAENRLVPAQGQWWGVINKYGIIVAAFAFKGKALQYGESFEGSNTFSRKSALPYGRDYSVVELCIGRAES